jgi:hypothetical protein
MCSTSATVVECFVISCVSAGCFSAEELFQDIWMNLVQARSRYRVEAKLVPTSTRWRTIGSWTTFAATRD